MYSLPMSVEDILSQIDAELEKLMKARVLLAAAGRVDLRKVTAVKAAVAAKPKRKRVLSAEARKRIAEAQRKRWAAQKTKSK